MTTKADETKARTRPTVAALREAESRARLAERQAAEKQRQLEAVGQDRDEVRRRLEEEVERRLTDDPEARAVREVGLVVNELMRASVSSSYGVSKKERRRADAEARARLLRVLRLVADRYGVHIAETSRP